MWTGSIIKSVAELNDFPENQKVHILFVRKSKTFYIIVANTCFFIIYTANANREKERKMKIKLFYDLYSHITKERTEDTFTEKKIVDILTKDDFLFYIIGSYSTNCNHIDYNKLSSEMTCKLLKGSVSLYSIFANEYFYILEKSKRLRLDELLYTLLRNYPSKAQTVRKNVENQDQISNLYKKYCISIPTDENTEKLLINLFTICITEDIKIFSSYVNQLFKPQTLKSILGRKNDANKLKDELNLYHKIIIHGQHGTGKTTFIKYCLNLWKPQDFCYISYKNDLRTTLEEIKYSSNFIITYFQKYSNALKETSSNSLLVIDHMYYSEDFKRDLDDLEKLPINVIVISLNTIPQNSFHNFEMSPLSDDLLKEIFKTSSNSFINNEFLWKELFLTTQKNVLMISLIAHQCGIIFSKSPNKSINSKETVLKEILSRLTTLERNEKGKNPSPFSSYKFKHIYDSKTLDVIGHVKSICNIFLDVSNKSLRNYMETLCLFGWEPIPFAFLSTILPSYNKDNLDKLSKMGLLVLLKDSVQLIPLVCHSIIFEIKPVPEKYEFLIENLIDFLNEYDKTLCVPYISDILFTFVKFLYPHVKRTNNPKQEKTSRMFEKWQELLYLTVYYYHQCGNFHIAEKIILMIQYPDLTSFHSSLDQSFLWLENSIHSKYDPENIFKKLGELLPGKVYSIKHLNLFLPCITQCNFIIGFYCYLQIYNMSGDKNVKALDKLPKLMSYHLYCPDSYMQKEFTLLSEEQTNYFIIANNLMKSFSFKNIYLCNDSHFTYIFSCFKKFTGMNLRISGMAFTIFMHSLFVYNKPYYNYDSRDNQLLYSFKTYIAPEIKTLQNQLNSCKLIPKETFQLCILSHTIVALIQRLCHSFVKESDKSSIAEMYNIGDLKKLLDYIFLSEDEKNTVLEMIDKFKL